MFKIDMKKLRICYLTDIPDRAKNSKKILMDSLAGEVVKTTKRGFVTEDTEYIFADCRHSETYIGLSVDQAILDYREPMRGIAKSITTQSRLPEEERLIDDRKIGTSDTWKGGNGVMGLGNNEQQIIKAIAENDIRSARKWAVIALDADKTKKNQWFVNKYKSILISEGANMIELPGNLKDIMLCEDVSVSFKEKRYYLTENQKRISEEIFRMAKVSGKLMEMQIPYKNATLLYGPPGTGKTMFGRYVAYKMKLPFCYLNFSRVIDSYMGATSRNISQAFTYASANPCVFMLDEVDTISSNRAGAGRGGPDKEIARVTITLMQEFDKLANDVVVIAATNRLDMLDDAFVSRCSLRYEMAPFTEDESRTMVYKFLNDVSMELSEYEVDSIIQNGKDQRAIMNKLIIAIAERIEVEETI